MRQSGEFLEAKEARMPETKAPPDGLVPAAMALPKEGYLAAHDAGQGKARRAGLQSLLLLRAWRAVAPAERCGTGSARSRS
jgi:hypothetical protein